MIIRILLYLVRLPDDHRLFDKLYSFEKVLDKYQGKLS